MGRRADGKVITPYEGSWAHKMAKARLNRKECPGCADRLMLWHGVHYVDGEPVMRCEAGKENT